METTDISTNTRKKLLSHYWDLSYHDYQEQVYLIWRQNSITVSIHFYCEPPGKEKRVHFDFFINGEHTIYEFLYNCYGCGTRGKTPEMLFDDHRLIFSATPNLFEIFEEKITQDIHNLKPKTT